MKGFAQKKGLNSPPPAPKHPFSFGLSTCTKQHVGEDREGTETAPARGGEEVGVSWSLPETAKGTPVRPLWALPKLDTLFQQQGQNKLLNETESLIYMAMG